MHDPQDAVYLAKGPGGLPVQVPRGFDGRSDARTAQSAPEDLRDAYRRDGYVVVRGLVDPALCERVQAGFDAEVRPDHSHFIRHESGKPERHVFTAQGHMKYPIMNVQDLPRGKYRRFRSSALDALTAPSLQRVIQALFEGPGKLMHTMYFEGNQVTWAHQDGHYIDSAELGGMVGVWIALEDIHPGAGRFYVCPGSHQLTMPALDGLDPNGSVYKAKVLDFLAAHDLACHAPALRKGDAILWNSRTIHGSLETSEPQHARRSLTGHFIPSAQDLVWFQRHRATLRSELVNGVAVHFHDDRNRWANRLRFWLKSEQPALLARVRALRAGLRSRVPKRA